MIWSFLLLKFEFVMFWVCLLQLSFILFSFGSFDLLYVSVFYFSFLLGWVVGVDGVVFVFLVRKFVGLYCVCCWYHEYCYFIDFGFLLFGFLTNFISLLVFCFGVVLVWCWSVFDVLLCLNFVLIDWMERNFLATTSLSGFDIVFVYLVVFLGFWTICYFGLFN